MSEEIVRALIDRIALQDSNHPEGYRTSRDGVRLALAAIEDELNEALEAHREERKCRTWHGVRSELLDIAAVAMAAVRNNDADGLIRSELVDGTYVPTKTWKESSR